MIPTTKLEKITIYPFFKYDEYTDPNKYDCYNEEDIKKWNNNEWFYVGLEAHADFVFKHGCNKVIMWSVLKSFGLWGIDFDYYTYMKESNQEHFKKEFADEVKTILDYIEALGINRRSNLIEVINDFSEININYR